MQRKLRFMMILEEECHCSNTSKLTLNESLSLLGITPIKSAGTRDRIGYGKKKVKRFKERITDNVKTACNFNKKRSSQIMI